MNTPAHLLIGAALLARPRRGRAQNLAVIAGAFAPDASLYGLVAWQLLVAGRTPLEVFGEDYFSPAWQTIFAIDNSVFVWGAVTVVGLWLGPRALALAGAAALIHLACDLPLHHDDGRPHLWPISDWVFESPVSYWDPAHYGAIVGSLELALCLTLGGLLWRWFRGWRARVLIVLALLAELSVGGVWALVFA